MFPFVQSDVIISLHLSIRLPPPSCRSTTRRDRFLLNGTLSVVSFTALGLLSSFICPSRGTCCRASCTGAIQPRKDAPAYLCPFLQSLSPVVITACERGNLTQHLSPCPCIVMVMASLLVMTITTLVLSCDLLSVQSVYLPTTPLRLCRYIP